MRMLIHLLSCSVKANKS